MALLKALRLLGSFLALIVLCAGTPAHAEQAKSSHSTPRLALEIMHLAWASRLDAVSQAAGVERFLVAGDD